jgi:hypothetical protein
MAIAVQQIRPVAHLPLVLGVLRRLEIAPLIDALVPPPRHMCSRLGMGSKPWSWPSWMVLMRCTR